MQLADSAPELKAEHDATNRVDMSQSADATSVQAGTKGRACRPHVVDGEHIVVRDLPSETFRELVRTDRAVTSCVAPKSQHGIRARMTLVINEGRNGVRKLCHVTSGRPSWSRTSRQCGP
jgi:hypothetical protein